MMDAEKELAEKNRELGKELVSLQAKISSPLASRSERERLEAKADLIAGEIGRNNEMVKKFRSDREFAEKASMILKLV